MTKIPKEMKRMFNLNDLISKVQEVANGSVIDFMVGRTKAEGHLPMRQLLTIKNFDFLQGDNGEYAVVIFEEDDQHFHFMGTVVTDKLKKIQENILPSELEELLACGIECVFEQKVSKNKFRYCDVLFFPNHQ